MKLSAFIATHCVSSQRSCCTSVRSRSSFRGRACWPAVATANGAATDEYLFLKRPFRHAHRHGVVREVVRVAPLAVVDVHRSVRWLVLLGDERKEGRFRRCPGQQGCTDTAIT